MPTLVLLRHGQSQWNLENRFTGWWDVDLSEQGISEARAAGRMLAGKGFEFDRCFTSVQTRAIRTLHLVLHELKSLWLPVAKDWRLNERHYGGLTGFNKQEMIDQVGAEQVKIWRRSFDVPRSEEHTSELQSLRHLVCRLLLEKKKNIKRQECERQ